MTNYQTAANMNIQDQPHNQNHLLPVIELDDEQLNGVSGGFQYPANPNTFVISGIALENVLVSSLNQPKNQGFQP